MVLDKKYKNITVRNKDMLDVELEYENEENLEKGINLAISNDNGLMVNIVIPKEDVFAIISKLVSDKCDNLAKELVYNE